MWNAGTGDLITELTVRPGTPDETFYEMLSGVGRENGDLSHTNPLELFLIFFHYKIGLPELGPIVEDLAQKVVVPLARLMGLAPFYPEFVTLAGTPLPIEDKDTTKKTSMFGFEDPVDPDAPPAPRKKSFFGKYEDPEPEPAPKPAAALSAQAPAAPEPAATAAKDIPAAAAVEEVAAAEAVALPVAASVAAPEPEPVAAEAEAVPTPAAEEEGAAAGLLAEEAPLEVDAQHMGVAQ